jgi:hypothetical protein
MSAAAWNVTDEPAAGDSAPPDPSDPQFLFELIVADLHWTSIQIGALTVMAAAVAASGAEVTLYTCRHLVHDDTRVVRLALRYGEASGLPANLVTRLDRLYSDIGETQRQASTFVASLSLTAKQRDQLGRLLPRLRQNAQTAGDCLVRLEAAARSLHPNYAADNSALQQFLARAVRGDLSDLDRAMLSPPRLKQRRHLRRAA